MHASLKERKQSKHSSKSDEAAKSGDTPKRCYGQGDHQEAQRPKPRKLRHVINGIGA